MVALSEDQKAMLRLLAQRGEQGYEDIAALKGIGADEVRAQARAAVKQLEDEGLPPPALPLEPEGAAPPEPPAESPKPEPPAPPPRQAPAAKAKASGPKIAFPSDPGVRGAIAAGALIVVALIVILIISGGDSGSDSTGTTAANTSAEEGAAETPVTNSREITKANLEAVDGSGASGTVIFGRVKNTLALQVIAKGLGPTAKGETYAIWLAQSPQKMLPLAATPVNKNGRITAQFEAPVEVLGYLANETFKDITITLVDEERLSSSLDAATKAKESPKYTGTEVLRGEVVGPIVGAASR